MRVTTLHYERKRSDLNFGNRSLSITVELEEGEDVALVIGQMAGLVRGRLDQDEQEEEGERRQHEEELHRRVLARTGGRHSAQRGLDPGDEDDDDGPDDEDDDEEEEALPF